MNRWISWIWGHPIFRQSSLFWKVGTFTAVCDNGQAKLVIWKNYVCIYIYIYICINVIWHVCMYVYIYICIIYIYTYVYLYMYNASICICVCIYIYIYINTWIVLYKWFTDFIVESLQMNHWILRFWSIFLEFAIILEKSLEIAVGLALQSALRWMSLAPQAAQASGYSTACATYQSQNEEL